MNIPSLFLALNSTLSAAVRVWTWSLLVREFQSTEHFHFKQPDAVLYATIIMMCHSPIVKDVPPRGSTTVHLTLPSFPASFLDGFLGFYYWGISPLYTVDAQTWQGWFSSVQCRYWRQTSLTNKFISAWVVQDSCSTTMYRPIPQCSKHQWFFSWKTPRFPTILGVNYFRKSCILQYIKKSCMEPFSGACFFAVPDSSRPWRTQLAIEKSTFSFLAEFFLYFEDSEKTEESNSQNYFRRIYYPPYWKLITEKLFTENYFRRTTLQISSFA